MKQLKDYLHLYLGCEAQLFWRNDDSSLEFERIGELISVRPENNDQYGLQFKCKTKAGNYTEYNYPYLDVKPILRPLTDMTDKERSEYLSFWGNVTPLGVEGSMKRDAEATKYLLSKHFDLFGLIEAGLAIDRTKLNSELSR